MAQIVTYTEAIANLRQWTEALQATALGQSYSIGGRTLTRQDNETIRSEIRRWHNTVTAMEAEQAGKAARPLGAQAAFPTPGSSPTAGGVIIPGSAWESGLT